MNNIQDYEMKITSSAGRLERIEAFSEAAGFSEGGVDMTFSRKLIFRKMNSKWGIRTLRENIYYVP